MTISEIAINYYSVFGAAFASLILGSLWYSPVLFGNAWAKLADVKKGAGPNILLLMSINFAAGLLTAFGLVHTIKYAGAITVAESLFAGFFTWLAYIAATYMLGTVLWERKPIKLYLINASYWLVNVLLMSAILAIWP